MLSKPRKHFQQNGLTLIELLAAVAIIAILAVLIPPGYQRILRSAEETICKNNLKNLRVAFQNSAEEGWPQVPGNIELGSRAEHAWWIKKGEEIDIPESTWICPTLRRLTRSIPEGDRPLIHYLPTPFSEQPGRANRSGEMPWFIEIGNPHGRGNLLIRQNGTIEPSG